MIMPGLGGTDPSAFAVGAPPVYGEHQFDILYGDLDPAGYMTPAGGLSGAGTPLNSQSRRGSTDNLASLNTLTSHSVATSLHSRLSSLDNVTDSLRATPPEVPTTPAGKMWAKACLGQLRKVPRTLALSHSTLSTAQRR